MNGHRGPVSALSMDHEEKGFFSAGWDGEAIVGNIYAHSFSSYNRHFSNGILMMGDALETSLLTVLNLPQ